MTMVFPPINLTEEMEQGSYTCMRKFKAGPGIADAGD